MVPTLDPIMVRFRRSLSGVYGDRISRVVLFGSRARGRARLDSDYDVAVFLARPESLGTEAARLAAIETEILMDTGAVINALPLEASSYGQNTAFMSEVRRDGVEF